MPDESTTHDLVERTRHALEALSRRDFDALMSYFAPDAVFEAVALGTAFQGVAAIRRFLEDFGQLLLPASSRPEAPAVATRRASRLLIGA